MLQTSHTLIIHADPDQIWVLLNDMIARPERYEDKVNLKTLSGSTPLYQRLVSRDGVRINETLEVHREALMVELTVAGEDSEPELSLIHQVVPSGARTILNLAATWVEEGLEDDAIEVNTASVAAMNRRLARLGARLAELAEALAR